MRRLLLLVVLILLAQNHYNSVCQSYGFDKGAILSLEGIYCERTVTNSFTTAYLPLEGARVEWGWKHQAPTFPTDGKPPQG